MGAHVPKLTKGLRFARTPVNIKISRSAAQKWDHVLKLNKGLLFARKPVHNNVSMSAAPILALVPASRYNCDVK